MIWRPCRSWRWSSGTRTETPADVPDALVEALRTQVDEASLVELTVALTFETFRGRVNNALGVSAQDFAEGAYCPAPRAEAADGRDATDLGSPSREASADGSMTGASSRTRRA